MAVLSDAQQASTNTSSMLDLTQPPTVGSFGPHAADWTAALRQVEALASERRVDLPSVRRSREAPVALLLRQMQVGPSHNSTIGYRSSLARAAARAVSSSAALIRSVESSLCPASRPYSVNSLMVQRHDFHKQVQDSVSPIRLVGDPTHRGNTSEYE
jgi:hypothetical protein